MTADQAHVFLATLFTADQYGPGHLNIIRLGREICHARKPAFAASFRAGVPQVIVPHIADQPYWGRRVHELGVGSAPISRKDFSVDRLVSALEVALTPEAGSAACDLGVQVRAEDGVGDAARLIRSLLSDGRALRDEGQPGGTSPRTR